MPVPAREGGRGEFRVLYYPARIAPDRFTAMTPTVSGRFELDSSQADRCDRLSARPIKEMGPGLPSPMSMTAYYRRQERLYEDVSEAANSYFRGRPLTPGGSALPMTLPPAPSPVSSAIITG
jgi:hypothetical protein